MTLVSVLLALILDRMLEGHRESRVSGWWGRLAEAVTIRLPANHNGVGAGLAIVLPPAVVMLAIQWLIGGWVFGLVGLAIAVVVLLFALGPLDVADVVEDYIDARRADDPERTAWYYERFTGEPPPDTPEEEGRRMVEALLQQAHDHIFATVFWFCLLGPAGAVLYRMTAESALHPSPALVARPELHRTMRYFVGILGWIPARLMAFGYAVTGSFERAVRRFRSEGEPAADLLNVNGRLLTRVGTAALRMQEDSDGAGGEAERRSSDAAGAVDGARGLALRAGVLWLAVLALLTLAGWLA